ncbi:MAG: AAA family ATPase [Myxococcales bacterium]|nr:AAA family ATPase [Myxococcales bacterium]
MHLIRRTVRPARRTKLTRRPANDAALLREVHIRSFKSLEDVRVELGLVNVFIGANGSGKSNLLEAIGLLGAAASGRVDDEGLLRRGVRPGLPRLYLSSFLESAEPQTIHLSACTGNATYDVELLQPEPSPSWHYGSELLTAGEQEILRRTNNGSQARNPTAGLAALELVELEPESPAASLLTSLREYAIHAPNTVTLRGLVSDPQTRAPLGLAGGRLAEALDELQDFARQDSATEEVIDDLRELIDWVADFGARRGGDVPLSPSIPRQQQVLYFRDRFMAAGRNELSAYDASEGALYVLFAMIAATHPSSPPLLAIDNVDAGLNPRLARALIERLCERVTAARERQLLLTSHNPLVLDGLPLQNDQVRLFAVDRSARGKTLVRRIEVTPELLAKAEEGWTLSRLWVMGHLGGVPDV